MESSVSQCLLDQDLLDHLLVQVFLKKLILLFRNGTLNWWKDMYNIIYNVKISISFKHCSIEFSIHEIK